MGLAEIIFSTFGFIIFWLIVFKVALMYNEKKPLKDIGTKIQSQEEKTFNIFGKNVKAGEVVDEKEEEEEAPVDLNVERTVTIKPKPKKKAVKKTTKKITKKVTKKKK